MMGMRLPLAFAAGCAVGVFALAIVYAEQFFRTCENLSDDGSFTCSNCGSYTNYKPKVPYRFCPICGACVIKSREDTLV